PVFIDAVQQAIGGDPLRALFGAGIATVFELARPLRARIGAAGADAVRVAVDVAGGGCEVSIHHREAELPAVRRIHVHAERMRYALVAVAGTDRLALVVDVELIRQ